MFEPPFDGTYILTVYATASSQNGPMFIKKNDDVLCSTFISENNGYNSATCTTIAQLAIADSVRVTGDSADPALIQAEYSGFAGHIINDNLTA